MPKTSTCHYCNRTLVYLDCEYPFEYHEGDTPRHGDWVPDHNCVADACKASPADRRAECGE